MKIAAYVNSHGQPIGLYSAGALQLYERQPEGWQLRQQAPLNISADMNIFAAKNTLKAAVAAALGDCRILLSGEVRGLLYSILQEELGFRTWKSEGTLHEQLEKVAHSEQELQHQEAQVAVTPEPQAGKCSGEGARAAQTLAAISPDEIPHPERLSEGHYRLDLEAALNSDTGLNSKAILRPFLESQDFQRFDLYCDHVPRWLARSLDELKLVADTEPATAAKAGVTLRITKKPDSLFASHSRQDDAHECAQ